MDAGLGHVGLPILFTNAGPRTCVLARYPGVAALDASGTQVAQAQRTPNGYLGRAAHRLDGPPVVELAVDQTASALVLAATCVVPSGVSGKIVA